MKTNFIIINYNDYKNTLKLVNQIKNYSIIHQIIIVDNHSSNDDYKKLQKIKNTKIVVLSSSENKGYGSGINIALKYLEDENDNCNVIISNTDIIIQKESDLEVLINDLKQTDLVGPIINQHGIISRGWKLPTPIQECLLNIPVLYSYFEKKFLHYEDSHYNKKIVGVDVISGCFFLSTLDTLKKINYFDENVFLYYEENILAVKLKKLNKKTIVDNTITVIHNHSITIDKNIKKYEKYKILKQSQYYFEKNYNNANTLEKMFLKLTIYFGIMIQYIRSKL